MGKTIKYFNLILILIIAVGLLFIVFRLATIVTTQNNSADDAQASGFGANATRDLFEPAAELFSNSLCEDIFNNETLQSNSLPLVKEANLELDTVSNLETEDYKPLVCEYNFGNGRVITFTIHSYDANSPIDDSQAALFERVNSNTLKSTIDSDVIGIMSYFYGVDSENGNVCRTNVYHPVNDFEYAEIIYTGFDCESSYNLNREITGVFNKFMFNAMEFVYNNYDNTTTADLLDEWGFGDLKTNLSFYE